MSHARLNPQYWIHCLSCKALQTLSFGAESIPSFRYEWDSAECKHMLLGKTMPYLVTLSFILTFGASNSLKTISLISGTTVQLSSELLSQFGKKKVKNRTQEDPKWLHMRSTQETE